MYRITIFFSFVFVSLATVRGGQQTDQDKFLLLENGQVIEGLIESDSENYWVVKPSGSRIAFSRKKVAGVTGSLSEIYWIKFSQLETTDNAGHVSLFRWCVKNDLMKEAHSQLDILRMLPIEQRQMSQINAMLSSKLEQQRQKIAEQATRPPVIPRSKSAIKNDPRAKETGHDATPDSKPSTDFAKNYKRTKELRELTKNMPGHSVVMFKRKIEPILIRSCYTAKCHDNSASEMPLNIAETGMAIPKRMSQGELVSGTQVYRRQSTDGKQITFLCRLHTLATKIHDQNRIPAIPSPANLVDIVERESTATSYASTSIPGFRFGGFDRRFANIAGSNKGITGQGSVRNQLHTDPKKRWLQNFRKMKVRTRKPMSILSIQTGSIDFSRDKRVQYLIKSSERSSQKFSRFLKLPNPPVAL